MQLVYNLDISIHLSPNTLVIASIFPPILQVAELTAANKFLLEQNAEMRISTRGGGVGGYSNGGDRGYSGGSGYGAV